MLERWCRARAATLCAALVAYVVLTGVLTWPLPRHLDTHLLGRPSGDTGVYVWNLWIFRHELLTHGNFPLATDHVFAYTGGADFSLHNYTPLAGLLALPLIGMLGVVQTYNLLLLAFLTCSGIAVFLLARRLGLSGVSAWAAGALFMASPVLTAKETAHFSLVTAAPLALFLWALLRTLDSRRLLDAVLVGVVAAVASYSDAYYGIYCGLMGLAVVAAAFLRVERGTSERARFRTAGRVLTAAIVVGVTFLAWRLVHGPDEIVVASRRILVRTLYTPVLVLTILLAVRGWLAWRPRVRFHDPAGALRTLAGRGAVAVAVCLALTSPLLVGLALRSVDERLPETAIYWRSSPRGVDLLAYLVPNPNHPWFGDTTRQWLLPDRPDAYPEYIAAFPLVALAVIAVAAWRRHVPRRWVVFTAVFAALSLGPFIYVGGVNTYVIGPWALLRYVPVVGMARSPARFAIPAALGFSLLFGFAVNALSHRMAHMRWAAGALLTAALAIELLPAPRTLYSAAVPMVYEMIASDNESGRLLELPTGIRDGTSSIGNFNPATEFFQTRHRHPVIGGYLSRVSHARKAMNRRVPMLRVVFGLSEGRAVAPAELEEARASRDTFLRRACLKYVLVDKHRASDELRDFAVQALGLTRVHEDDEYLLYTVAAPPPCDPPKRRERRLRWVLAGRLP